MNAKLNGQRTEMYELMVERLNGTKISEDESRTLLWIAGMERSSARNIAAIFDKVYGEGYHDGVKAVADAVNAGSASVALGDDGSVYEGRRERVYDE